MNHNFSISPTLSKEKVFLLQRSQLEKRLDPNFYLKMFKENVERIKKGNFKKLSDLVSFSSETWNQKDLFEETFPYIEISEVDTLTGEILNISLTEKNKAPSRAKMIVRENDIIISTTRPNRGAISHIDKDKNLSIASTGFSVLRGLKSSQISKDYLFVALRQQFSLLQMLQRSSGGNYPAITQDELGNIVIPLPPKDRQERAIQVIRKTYEQRKLNEAAAGKLLGSIDDYLLKELGITLPKPPENNLKNRIFTTSIKEISGGRFDPKLYTKQAKGLIDSLYKTKFRYQTLKSLIIQSCSGDWGNDDKMIFDESEFVRCLVIRATEFDNKFNLNVDGSRAKCRLISKEKYKSLDIQINDLLIEKSGGSENQPVGRIAILLEGITKKNTLCFSNFIHKIRLNKDLVYPEFAFNYLKTIYNIKITDIMQSQTNGIRNLILSEYVNLPISLPLLDKQKEIANHISEIRRQAQSLKDKTKAALEKASKQIEEILLN